MLTLAMPFSPLTSSPSYALSGSSTLWRCSSSPSYFSFSNATSSSTTLLAPTPLPPPPSPNCRPVTRSPSPSPCPAPHRVTASEAYSQSYFSLDCSSPTLSPSPSLSASHLSSCPSSPASSSSPFSSSRVSRYLHHLPPMAQHQFYHWLHIRSLYESQFSQYAAAGSMLPLDIHTETVTSSQPLTLDSYRVHLTTTTTTVMPHATATTSTSTSYRQLTSAGVCLPPSPPLLAAALFVPPTPFSYDFTYPSHPFSYPPAAVLEALPAAMRDDEENWGGRDEEADTLDEHEHDEVEVDGEEAEAEKEQAECEWHAQRGEAGRWLNASGSRQAHEGDATDDSDDEWSDDGADDDVTEAGTRSSYAPSYTASYACSDAEDEKDVDEEGDARVVADNRRREQVTTYVGLSF